MMRAPQQPELLDVERAVFDQLVAVLNTFFIVHIEQLRSAATFCSQSQHVALANYKVSLPLHRAWIEEINVITCERIDR
jgi:hypothetical protein